MQAKDTAHRFAEHGSAHASAPDAKLFRRFAELALGMARDPRWATMALQTQRVLDALRQSGRCGGAMQPV
jgi:hypothetical protein